MVLGRLLLVVVVLEHCRGHEKDAEVFTGRFQDGATHQENVPRDHPLNVTENGNSDNEEDGKEIPENAMLRESVRTSSVMCDDMDVIKARKLCPDLTRNINVRDLQHLTDDEVRLLQRLYSRNQYPAYINQGNSVHIQGGFQNPVPQVISTGGSQSLLMKNKPNRRPGFHYANPQPSTVNFNLHSTPVQRPSSVGVELPQSQSNVRQSMTRVNSKLLANITAASQKYFQNLRNYPMMQNSHAVGSLYNEPKNNNNPFFIRPDNQYSNHNTPLTNNQGFTTRPTYPQNVPSYPTPNIPVRNIINLKMPNSPEKHTEEKADMAEILTNLQILTILMNQDAANKLDVKGTQKLPPGMTFANSGSVSDTVKQMITSPKPRRTEGNQLQRHQTHGYPNSPSANFRPRYPYSQQPIEARTRRPDIFPGPFSQFPFSPNPNVFPSPLGNPVKNSERTRPNHVGQKAPGLNSYFLDQASPGLHSFQSASSVPTTTVSPVTVFGDVGALISPYTPQELLAESQSAQKKPDINSSAPDQSEPKPDSNPGQEDITVTEKEPEVSTDNEKLINQFAWNPNSVAHEPPLYHQPQKPQVPGTQASADKLEALHNYLAFMNNYQTTSRPLSHFPTLQNDQLPNLSNQDLLLAYLLQSQGLGQTLPTLPTPPALQPDTPYIPAVHSGLYSGLQTEPQPPAPPPSAIAPPVGASSGVDITQPLFTPGASASSIEDCLKSKVCAFFLAGLIAAGTTTALAIPIFTPIVGAGLLGKRRRRDVDYLVLTPENATEFVHTFTLFENGEDINKLTKEEKNLYNSFLQQLNGNSQTFLTDLKEYISRNKDELLNLSVKEIEYITHNPIPADLIHHLKHDTLNNQLKMLNKLMNGVSKTSEKEDNNMNNKALQDSTLKVKKITNSVDSKKNTKIVRRDAVYTDTKNKGRNVTNRQDIKEESQEVNDATEEFSASLLLKEENDNLLQSNTSLIDKEKNKFQNVTLPDRIQSNESHVNRQANNNSNNANTMQGDNNQNPPSRIKPPVPQGPPLRKNIQPPFVKSQGVSYHISTPERSGYKIGPAYGFPMIIPFKEVPDHRKPLQGKIHQFYKVLCGVINSPDIPKIDIITFIAQRCLLLAYAGLIR
ncbi:uncharacterized protein LOC122255884 [Penaeus japonicus]|uniref:uncharacterized protein LOC122255884 n=1 Tax=Penaeus japonicus TaxID=27405 RepID=UPI001C710E6D|nr:uncharacterized protein LOC122255884 [Penaeus japonicus]XP_042876176.1 uncharacterized protein LOC122255884 [Penaeus japonicus]